MVLEDLEDVEVYEHTRGYGPKTDMPRPLSEGLHHYSQ
jgi:hypothetical protein